MFKRVVWPVLFIGFLLLSVVFIGGLAASLVITSAKERIDKSPSQEIHQAEKVVEPQEDGAYNLILIGDSLATGIGDEFGRDLGDRYVELAKEEGDQTEWKVVNLSLPGSQTSDWVQLLEEDFYENALQRANLIFLSLGGNNIKEIYQGESAAGLIEYEEALKAYLLDIQTIIESIREANPDAQVVFIGLYNPYGASISEQKIQLLLEWNHETQLRVDENLNQVYVPLYDLFKYHQDTYLFLDDFHPNEEGYNAIANRIYEVVGKRK